MNWTCTALLLGVAGAPAAAFAQESHPDDAWAWYSAAYDAEVAGPVSGGLSQRGVFLDNLSVEAGLDLGRVLSWSGAQLNVHLLNNTGGDPNTYAGTLEGVSNLAVARPRAKVYELWLDQSFADSAGSFVVGLYDLNRDFYATESASLLTAPPFGIGSELASTGPNGPSIFPSTALGARARYASQANWYLQAAAYDAKAGVPGDPGGVSADFAEGALLIAEAGLTRSGKLAFGGWTYTREQDDIRDTSPGGDPEPRTAFGLYGMWESRIWEGAGALDGFVRSGLSDGDTTDFAGGGQAGVLWSGMAATRPDAQVSFGLRYGALSGKAQDNLRDDGVKPVAGEWGMELTYADALFDWLRVQPTAQVVFNAGGDADADPVVVLGLRLSTSISGRF